jgi:hypothetical protein
VNDFRFGLRPSYQNFGTYGREIEELEYYDEYEQQEDIFPANSKANVNYKINRILKIETKVLVLQRTIP